MSGYEDDGYTEEEMSDEYPEICDHCGCDPCTCGRNELVCNCPGD